MNFKKFEKVILNVLIGLGFAMLALAVFAVNIIVGFTGHHRF
jgi:hypothetical protein